MIQMGNAGVKIHMLGRIGFVFLLALFLLTVLGGDQAEAKQKKKSSYTKVGAHQKYVQKQQRLLSKKRASKAKTSASGEKWWENSSKYASIVVDGKSGKVLTAANPDGLRHPASLTKVMTAYLAFEKLRKGVLKLDQPLYVSAKAAAQPALNIGLQEGDKITVELALTSLAVRSANDSAVVLAEAIAGSEERFAGLMTRKAQQLGMRSTVFMNASGLPDDEQVTTARDMVKLGMALKRDFPEYYGYFSRESFQWNGRGFSTHNRVNLLYEGADGIKTGYVNDSGYNLLTSAERSGKRLFAVVLGGPTGGMRDKRMMALLDDGFGSSGILTSKTIVTHNDDAEDDITAAFIKAAKAPAQERNTAKTAQASAATDKAIGGAKLDKIIEASAGKSKNAKNLWSIQIGTFADAKSAMQAARNSFIVAANVLNGSKIKVVSGGRNDVVHRARIINISLEQAQKACQILHSTSGTCFVVKPRDV